MGVLGQCLSVFVYLHAQPNPIAHREIEPEHIFVQSRSPLHVELGDLGLVVNGAVERRCGNDV